jgi:hypothetical protein
MPMTLRRYRRTENNIRDGVIQIDITINMNSDVTVRCIWRYYKEERLLCFDSII